MTVLDFRLRRPHARQVAAAAARQIQIDRKAVAAFDRRLTQLEEQHAASMRTLRHIEKAVAWLPADSRPGARRRLTEIGLDPEQHTLDAA
jgi:hypothetical protein